MSVREDSPKIPKEVTLFLLIIAKTVVIDYGGAREFERKIAVQVKLAKAALKGVGNGSESSDLFQSVVDRFGEMLTEVEQDR